MIIINFASIFISENAQPVNKSRWMTDIRSHIGDKRIGHIVIPGSHDAGTFGIDENFILVDRNLLFELAHDVTPQTLSNWSITQVDNFWRQLGDGYRYFDLRIADVEEDDDGNFRWWHGVTGDRIQEGLNHFIQFARQNPGEILLLNFNTFARPGDDFAARYPIPEERLDVLTDIIFDTIGEKMIPFGDIPQNPTVDQVLATGNNIIAYMSEGYVRELRPQFWPSSAHYQRFSGMRNPEDLFNHRSESLRLYKDDFDDVIVRLSGCVTPNANIILGSLRNRYRGDPFWDDLFDLIGLGDLEPSRMSFEGLWMDLVSLTREGVNTLGMRRRPANLYTNGGSVHYSGLNDWIRHWAARPNLYRINVVYLDVTSVTTFVETAIQANRGEIPREVTLAFQGNPRDGFYEWDGLETIGGADGLSCSTGFARYRIRNGAVITRDWTAFENKSVLNLQEGQFPAGSTVEVEVGGDQNNWFSLFSGNIQNMIQTNQDLYLRVAITDGTSGFGYMDSEYDLFGDDCEDLPLDADYQVRW